MMASMVAKVSSSCSSKLSQLSIQEKGSRNKRKFRADPPLSDANPKVLPSSLSSDGLTYEVVTDKLNLTIPHDHVPGACEVCGVVRHTVKLDLGLSSSAGALPDATEVERICPPSDEVEGDDLHDADWSDLTEGQLEDLVLSNLDIIFKGAIKKIIACGYTEEVAIKAVLMSGLCYGSKDAVSNVVDNALAFLRNGQEVGSFREHCFEDLQQLTKYVLAELVCVLREVRPFFSTGDAMWCLLICDMNVSHACAMDGDPLSSLIIDGSSNNSSSSALQDQPKADPKHAEMSLLDPCKTIPANHGADGPQVDADTATRVSNNTKPNDQLPLTDLRPEKDGPLTSSSNPLEKPFCAVGITRTPGMEGKIVSSRKVHSTSSKILRQKSLHLEKSYRASGTKGALRAAKFSGFILDKRYKSISDSAALNLKSASVKISKAMAMGFQLAQEHGALNVSTGSAFSTSPRSDLDTKATSCALPVTDHASPTPLGKPIPAMPAADTELSLSLPSKSDAAQANVSCDVEAPNPGSTGLTCDRSLEKWVPRNEKDEMIVKLIPRIRELQNQLQEWTEWANQKVMQAARRLSKDKAELKTLRLEKEEVERLKREKQSFEDNTMKKLSEMENALGKASGQVGRANAAVRRLDVENAALRREMEVAKLRAAESAASCQEVSEREKKMLMKFQSWEKQKSTFQEELAAERRQLSQMQQEVEQAKDLQRQLETRWKQEEKAKEEIRSQAKSIRKERERLEASVKRKEEAVKQKAEANLQRYQQDIHNLEKQISQLTLKTDSSKIAALKRGINSSLLPDPQTNPASKEPQHQLMANTCELSSRGGGGVKRERECVMCLSEEMSVVFLPCAHQVVCKMCNELHQKQGMNDCPSCRCPIVQRICVRYARP